LAHQFRERASDALDELKVALATLPDDLVELVGLLLARRRQVLEAFRRLEKPIVGCRRPAFTGVSIWARCWRARGDFVVLDFEGSRGALAEERRRDAVAAQGRRQAWCAPSVSRPRRAGQLSGATAAGRGHT